MAGSATDVLKVNGRNPESIVFGPFRFVPGDGLWRDGQPVPLPPRAIGVLTTLVATPGEVVTKQALMDAVWPGTFVTESSLLEAIGLLRDSLGDDRKQPRFIQTVHRRGYRFIGQTSHETRSSAVVVNGGTESLNHREAMRPILIASEAYSFTTICVAIVFAIFGQHPVDHRISRFSISLPSDATIDPMRGSVAVSLDGSKLAYVATAAGRSQLFLRSVDRDEPAPIAGTEDASDPFFSPDGQWVGFFARGSLQKVRVDGGSPVLIAAARAGAGATTPPRRSGGRPPARARS